MRKPRLYVYLLFRHAENYEGIAGAFATLKQAQLVREHLGADIHQIVAVQVAGFPWGWLAALFGLLVGLALKL
jgi:hypothetical protein